MSGPLVIVPVFLRSTKDLRVTVEMMESLRSVEPDVDVLMIDDGSPAVARVDELEGRREDLGFELVRKEVNSGFSRTVNMGLERCLEEGRDAILCNADLAFGWPWVEAMMATTDAKEQLAPVVGARLLYPNGLIQHAGVYFSMLHRTFAHRYQYAPHDLPEAMQSRSCPVTGALQLVRLEALQKVGLYDEDFNLAFEDMDYCCRVFEADLECIYNPLVIAYHHESMFRGQGSDVIDEWHRTSWATFVGKHQKTQFGSWIWPLC